MSMAFFRRVGRSAKDKAFGSTQDTALGVQKKEMADARLGVLYFLGNTRAVPKPKLELGLVGSFVADTTALSDLKDASLWIVNHTGPGKKVVEGVTKAKDWVADKLKPITDLIKNFFNHLKIKIVETFGEAWDGIEAIAEYIVWATAELSQVLTNLIPGWGYVQSAADMYKGAKQAVVGVIRFVDQLYSGWGVKLMGGHPSVIANALARHSLVMIGSGLKDVAIAGVKIGLQAGGDALAGVGAVFSAVAGALQRIVALIDRFIQRFRVQAVLKRAHNEWLIHKSDTCIASNHKQFSEWFQNAVITTPIIAALTLGSGFAGHPYRFLQLIHTGDQVVTQAQFDAGVKHIEKLKSLASKYVSSYVDDYRTDFVSDDELVKARLLEIVHGKGLVHVVGP